ncbi:MAG: hypothetical protein ACI8ZO_000753 [Flavobacteriales bacterium]|jgi:hypothetical protein
MKNQANKETPKVRWQETYPVVGIIFKTLILTLVVLGTLLSFDNVGLFEPDQKNNHTLRKWDAYYDFTKKNDVDILLVGNSHLYTGINPKTLSSIFGCNSFILASPGTNVVDHYYVIKEAIRVSKPKVIVLETYGLKGNSILKDAQLSDLFKSFQARRNFGVKMTSMPSLFEIKSYPYAWFNCLRNHDFLYTNMEQIDKNIALSKKKAKKNKKLYLGRYVRFQSGLQSATLQRYKSEGAPVNGADFIIGNKPSDYIQKTVDFCKEEGIELVFLTLPMYKDHVSDYLIWKDRLNRQIIEADSSVNWIDMQTGSNYKGFNTESFEDTYGGNQHMTYKGSLLATYKLAEHLNLTLKTPIIKNESESWKTLFYGQEGFFENHNPNVDDKKNKILFTGTASTPVKEVLFLERDKYNTIMVKTIQDANKNWNFDKIKGVNLKMELQFPNKPKQVLMVQIPKNPLYKFSNKILFNSNLQKFKVFKLLDVTFY